MRIEDDSSKRRYEISKLNDGSMKTRHVELANWLDQKLVNARKENLRRLGTIEHRLEFVDEVDGVEYINDAKASDINSSWYSIECIDHPLIWIISSCNYEEDYSLFYEVPTEGVKALVVLGPNQEAIEEIFRGRVKTIARAEHMLNALQIARSFATSGDAVLYSPAFSDMEQHTPFKERGQQFRKAVREMRLQ